MKTIQTQKPRRRPERQPVDMRTPSGRTLPY